MIVNDRHLKLQAKLGMVQPFTPANVQGSSIDLTLGSHIQIESPSVEAQWLGGIDMSDQGYQLSPGEFILAHTEETIQVPTDCAAMVLLRSSAARAGFEHSLAGWCDPGFNGQNTLELRNNLRSPAANRPWHALVPTVVHKLQDTAVDHYGVRGNYQHQAGATLSNLNFDREAA